MYAISDPTRAILLKLGQILFPLEKWTREERYHPPAQEDLPWHQPGMSLTFASMLTLERLEKLIDQASTEEELRQRWLKIAAAPRCCRIRPRGVRIADWTKSRCSRQPIQTTWQR
jgi:hypothetical protein